MAAGVRAAILRRAQTVRRLGEWTGLFDFAVYAATLPCRVIVLIGDAQLDVLAHLIPEEDAKLPADRPVRFAVATKIDDGLLLVADGGGGVFPNANHWMAATPLAMDGSSLAPAMAASGPVSQADRHSHSDMVFLLEHYRTLGYVIHRTAAQGDCGPDSLLFSTGMQGDPVEWLQWRLMVSDAMQCRAADPSWQDAFLACGEEVGAEGEAGEIADETSGGGGGASGLGAGEASGPGEGEAAGPGAGEASGLGAREAAGLGAGEASGLGAREASGPGAGEASGRGAGEVLGLSEGEGEAPGPEEAAGTRLRHSFKSRPSAADRAALAVPEPPMDMLNLRQIVTGVFGPLTPEGAISLVGAVAEDSVEQLRKDLALARRRMRPPGSRMSAAQVRETLSVRVAIGELFNSHKAEAIGRGERNFVRTFADKHFRCNWSMALSKRIRDSGKLVASGKDLGKFDAARRGARDVAPQIGGLAPQRAGRDTRKHVFSTQGRPLKALPVRDALLEWFVNIRGAIKGRIWPKFMLMRARALQVDWIEAVVAEGGVPDPFKADYAWLRRFKKKHGLSWRTPNKRYKMSYANVKKRMLTEWLNNARVRHFGIRMLGVDIGQHIDNADQKGWFRNNVGNRNKATLAFGGRSAECEIKENHSATRERMSFMTYTSNNEEHIARGLPLELCFRMAGPGTKVLHGGESGLKLPPGRFSVRVSNSGSYREEHVYLFLETHLEALTPERIAAKDWRILYLDLYAAHMGRRLWDLCWSRHSVTSLLQGPPGTPGPGENCSMTNLPCSRGAGRG